MVIVDQEKCTGCGLCEKDCLLNEIKIVDGLCTPVNQVCYDCGHCIAICPEGAISPKEGADQIVEYEPEAFDIEPDRMLNYIKFRRTIRNYQQKSIPEDVMTKVLEAGMYSPTGRNSQSVRYIVVEKDLAEVTRMGLETLNGLADVVLADPKESKITKIYAKMWKDMYADYNANGRDGMFYNAPAVVMVIGNTKKSPSTAELDGGIASANIEMMAHTLGLGTCYSGFFNRALQNNEKIAEFLGLRKNEVLVTSFSIGYPAVTYHRTVARKKDKITWR